MNSTWGPGYWRSPRRDEPAVLCDLCGTKVGASRLIVSQVQGLEGANICDLHPNEVDVRSNPSFLDRGGTSQVPGPIGNWYPNTGPDVPLIYPAVYLEKGFTNDAAGLADIPTLTIPVIAGRTYAVRVEAAETWTTGSNRAYGVGGTATASAVSLIATILANDGSAAAGASVRLIGALSTPFSGFLATAGGAGSCDAPPGTTTIVGTIAISGSGTLTLMFRQPTLGQTAAVLAKTAFAVSEVT